ncbi:biopolymer transporter ExbB [Candidatus Halocynthiibacter alkanivorans]|uniref:biopolymer transporter ExbB n=1 Tax=Candidatus Halocynthiibacter alkanivorans TaxID=2267619 RepID=UPI000DF2C415|nr:biopolymer transporter ExbB [Candidatus Halocynthiibacter alkanivorans]
MDKPDRTVELHFSQPVRQILTMLVVLGLVAAGLALALPRVLPVFLTNPYLNGFIVFVFVIGVGACFTQMIQLVSSVLWIERFIGVRPKVAGKKAPRLLAPLAALLRGRGARSQISPTSSRSILDSVATRIDEARDITRYIVNLLIFLGLLGTFYGLATTVPALVETIRSLTPKDGETSISVLERLMSGLESQLGGMGTAFASSLLGLAGSLVVGLLELFASHGQNRFFRELEEWMSKFTRISFAEGDSHDGIGHDGGGISGAVMDQMAEQMDALQQLFTQSDVSRSLVDERLGQLAGALERMTLRMENEQGTSDIMLRIAEGQDRLLATLGSQTGIAGSMERMLRQMEADRSATEVMMRVAEGQERLLSTLEAQADAGGGGIGADGGIDAESRMRLRSIDVQLLRILEELSAGRQETVADLRSDLSALAQAMRLGGR